VASTGGYLIFGGTLGRAISFGKGTAQKYNIYQNGKVGEMSKEVNEVRGNEAKEAAKY